jgi:hypothetical protein
MWHVWKRRKIHGGFLRENLRKRDLGVDKR